MQSADVFAAITRAIDQYSNLLVDEAFAVTFEFRWVIFTDNSLARALTAGRDDRA